MQLLVYTPTSSPRVNYIFSTLLPALGIGNYHVTSDKISFINSNAAKINYSGQPVTNHEVWVKPADLLFEKEIKKQAIDCFTFNGIKAFFKTCESDFPFDIFSASFYLVTRYEEYLPYKQDMYGRYAHENSLSSREGFLNFPQVNIWLPQLAKELLKKFPSLQLTPPTFHFLPTYDIDIAWSYLHKGWIRNAGGLVKSMIDGDWLRANERINVLFGKQKDPFDSYDWLDELHKKYSLEPIYFFLMAGQNKHYDKNILPGKKAFQKLINQHNATYDVGIHPSWQSGDKPESLKNEIETLERITGKKVDKARQHYIRMTFPETYRQLIISGIWQDYSMGYGSINGFRASYCLPYKWYDLQKEESTSLTIFPFCYMDANSYYEQHYTPEQALMEMEHYFKITKEVNGLLITIWHNHFLGTDIMFKGWREIYKAFAGKMYSLISP